MTVYDWMVAGSRVSPSLLGPRTVCAAIVLGLSLAAMGCGGASGPEPEAIPEATPGLRVLTGGRLIVGTGSTVIEDGVLVVRDGRVESVGESRTVEIPDGAEHVDVSGKTIIPGLINAHGHVNDVRGIAADPSFYTETHVEDQLGALRALRSHDCVESRRRRPGGCRGAGSAGSGSQPRPSAPRRAGGHRRRSGGRRPRV